MAFVLIVLFYVLMRRTSYGRMTVATGSNETAVRLAGLPASRYKFLAYTICGGLAALAGIVVTSRTSVGTPITASRLNSTRLRPALSAALCSRAERARSSTRLPGCSCWA